MDSFYINYFRVSLELDADPNARAMTHYVENPARILRLVFSSIAKISQHTRNQYFELCDGIFIKYFFLFKQLVRLCCL